MEDEIKKMDDTYVKLLLGAVIIFAIGITCILSDLYVKVCTLEHEMMHVKGVKNTSCPHNK